MPRSFQLSLETPASVDQVYAAFGDENYWRSRLIAFGAGSGAATLESLTVDEGGTLVVATTFRLLQDRLPKFVSQLSRGDLEMVHIERWTRTVDSQVLGEVRIALPGTSVSAAGKALVAPLPDGAQMKYSATVRVKIPLVGGRIESFMSNRLAEGIMDIQRFTTAWIAQNC